MFLKTPEDFLGPKAILKIQFFSSGDEVFSPQTSAAFFVNFGFFLLSSQDQRILNPCWQTFCTKESFLSLKGVWDV